MRTWDGYRRAVQALIQEKAERDDLSTQERVVERLNKIAGTSLRTYQSWWAPLNSDTFRAPEKHFAAIARFLGAADGESLFDYIDRVARSRPNIAQFLPVPAALSPTGPVTDRKNLITQSEVSRRLRPPFPKPLPPFSEVVLSTRMWHPTADEKEKPALPNWEYNHLFQPSVVLIVSGPELNRPNRLLVYARIPDPSPEGVRHMRIKGFSALFGASYYLNSRDHPNSPMDEWARAVQAGSTTERLRQLLIGEPSRRDAVLLQVVGHKLGLAPLRGLKTTIDIEPFRVVMRGTKKIDTQYVFRVDAKLHTEPDEKFWDELRGPEFLEKGERLWLEELHGSDLLVRLGSGKTPRLMDVAVVSHLRGDGGAEFPSDAADRAHIVRASEEEGFQI